MSGFRRILTNRAAWLASTALVIAATQPAMAQDATWQLNPGTGDFNTAANWTPAAVPTGTAFFGASGVTALSLSSFTSVGGWTFDPGAPAYSFTADLTNNLSFTGAGIVISGGSASITVQNSALMTFSNASTAGSATITATNAGAIRFHDTSTLGNATVLLNGGNLEFMNASTAGNAIINNNSSGGTILFHNGSTAGSATITNDSGGGIHFNGTSTAGSATITLNIGAITFNGTSTAGSATIINNANVYFDGDSSGGNARLIANAGGTFRYGNLTSGGTTAGSIEGAGDFNLGSSTLTVGGNGLSTTVSGTIKDEGSGSLVKTGAGILTLTGDNIYAGSTTIDAGTLRVDGYIYNGATVNNGATLAGIGTVSNTTVNSGGTLAAGNGTAGSSLNVNGSLALQSGAFYMVQINPATSSFANVTGAATLNGATLQANYANGNYVSKQYTILTAGSINGTFGTQVDTNLPANFHTTLSYDATHAYLNLILNFGIPGNINGNQQAVGNALTGFFNTTGGIPMVFSALSAAGLSQASGETATGSQQTTFNAMTQFMGLMTDPFTAGRADGANAPAYAEEEAVSNAYASRGRPRSNNEREAYAAIYSKAPLARNYDPRWSVWGAGFGGSQTTDGNVAAGSNDTSSRLFGVAAGADYIFSPSTVAGFALAGGGTSFSVTGGGSGRSDLFQAGAFIKHKIGAAYISGALAYGWQDVTTDRTVTIAGIDRLRAQFNANAFSGRAEAGYRFVSPWIGRIGITPYAAGQFTTLELPAYTEQVVSGANTFALAHAAKSVTATRSELGLRADKSFAMQSAILTLRGRAAWAHDFNPDRAVAATFQTLPGASFVVNGARQASDAALTTASAEVKWMNGWSATGTFEGEFSNVTRSYAGKGVARYTW